jgi:type II secretory pathway pseudopilin PulG
MQTPTPNAQRRRSGYSLAEMLLAITITIMIFGAAVPFFTYQLRSLSANLGRTDAQMTARYAQNTIDRELRNIGIAVTPIVNSLGITRPQPKIIQADRFAVSFNTDLVANDTSDIQAVYVDPNVDTLLTTAMDVTAPLNLPLAAKSYPDFTYRNTDGSRSYAETVSYWATVDSTSGKTDEYVIFRRVNTGPISVVARGIQIPAGQALFSYTRVDSAARIVAVATSSLPVYWDAANSWADSIRTVTVNLKGIFHGRNLHNDTATVTRTVNSQTSLANIGLAQLRSCGDIPLNPGAPTVAMVQVAGVNDHVDLVQR